MPHLGQISVGNIFRHLNSLGTQNEDEYFFNEKIYFRLLAGYKVLAESQQSRHYKSVL